ncbi:hypothetical protein [Bosea sp. AS-1]|uniref:hypothetical protein n=1 Tax=Bosea sp. AS-1 TaxID=2015316 RepID=UPI000B77186A|nr:hypothetical protein [Bosea sp. AS-1]
MADFLTNLRLGASKWLLMAAAVVAPRYMRIIIAHSMKGFLGIAGEIQNGLDGGVMITPWFTSDDGAELASVQAIACRQEAARVRKWHTGKPKAGDGP